MTDAEIIEWVKSADQDQGLIVIHKNEKGHIWMQTNHFTKFEIVAVLEFVKFRFLAHEKSENEEKV